MYYNLLLYSSILSVHFVSCNVLYFFTNDIMWRFIGADLPGAVGANAPKGKGSVGACTQGKIVKITIRKMHTLWSNDSQEN